MSEAQTKSNMHEVSARESFGSSIFKQFQWPIYYSILIVNDVLLLGAAFRIAYWIRFELLLTVFRLDVEPSLSFYSRLVLVMLPIWIIIFLLMGLYRKDNLLGGTKEYALLWRGTMFSLLLMIVIGFLEPELIIARGFLLLAWGLAFIFVAVGRFVLRRFVYQFRKRGYYLVPALVVGGNEEGNLLAQQILDWSTSGLKLKAVLTTGKTPHSQPFKEDIYFGEIEELDGIIARMGIRELILATSALSRDEMLSIFNRYGVSEKVNLRLSSGLFEIITTGLQIKELAYIPLVSVEKVRLTGLDRVLKLVMDYSLAVIAIVVLSPLLVITAILVRLDSRGPILHRRRVMGLNGIKFDAYKFRTMHEHADEMLAADPELKAEFDRNHKLHIDPRVTAIGEILRRYSIDELPQFFNILRGEMSLVGPRMISPEEMSKYNQWGLNLLTVKPGITGLWQVSGRSDVSYEERVKMDMYYIRNWTIWLDLYLLIQTIPAVIKARGAY